MTTFDGYWLLTFSLVFLICFVVGLIGAGLSYILGWIIDEIMKDRN